MASQAVTTNASGKSTPNVVGKRWLLRNCRKSHDWPLKMSVQSHCGVTGKTGEHIFEKQREEVKTSG